jgi:subtilisin family serine protease
LQNSFPSNMQQVIGVDSSPTLGSTAGTSNAVLFAPGNRILVAVPTDQYDFRSGSSLATAHVSGVIALLLAVAPDQSPDTISSILQRSQVADSGSVVSINACSALNLAGSARRCSD